MIFQPKLFYEAANYSIKNSFKNKLSLTGLNSHFVHQLHLLVKKEFYF